MVLFSRFMTRHHRYKPPPSDIQSNLSIDTALFHMNNYLRQSWMSNRHSRIYSVQGNSSPKTDGDSPASYHRTVEGQPSHGSGEFGQDIFEPHPLGQVHRHIIPGRSNNAANPNLTENPQNLIDRCQLYQGQRSSTTSSSTTSSQTHWNFLPYRNSSLSSYGGQERRSNKQDEGIYDNIQHVSKLITSHMNKLALSVSSSHDEELSTKADSGVFEEHLTFKTTQDPNMTNPYRRTVGTNHTSTVKPYATRCLTTDNDAFLLLQCDNAVEPSSVDTDMFVTNDLDKSDVLCHKF